MILTTQDKIERLVKAFDEDHESDAASVLERWRDELEDVERQHAEFLKASAQPVVYGLIHGQDVPQSSDTGHQFFQFQPDAKYRVLADDMAKFAHDHHVPLDRLMDVVEGRIREYGGFRSWEGRGLANKPYRMNVREKLAALKEIRQEEKKHSDYLDKQPVYVTPKEVEVIDYGF